MSVRLAILGWDSATFDLVDPLVEQGRLPAIARLMAKGSRAPLRSTWPPMTDCAWTGAFTGRNAGGHGIFGSWYRAPGAYACRYFSARDRVAPALWEMGPDVRWLVWNIPMTYPPARVNGVMVSGYGAPPGASFCEPASFQEQLGSRWPLDDLLDRAPHGSLEGFLDDLLRGLRTQAEALPWAAATSGAECVAAVWPHVDRAQHFFWRFRGTDHPLSDAVERVYEAMDQTTDKLMNAWPDADFLVVSDHGAGPLHGDVNVGGWLVARGQARYGRARSAPLLRLAWAMPPALRRLGRRLAPTTARRAFGATLAGQLGPFDWPATRAFVGFHGDLWLNLAGRESDGCVSPADADELLGEIAAGLLEIEDPETGARVFAGAHRRDELYSGPAASLGPDLMLDSWSAGYRVAPTRTGEDLVIPPEPLAGVQASWSSDHRPVGILAAAGPRIAAGSSAELSLLDVCPTALALLEQEVPAGLDGSPAEGLLDATWLEDHPIRRGPAPRERDPTAGGTAPGYSDEEAAAVATHLKDLGYIE